MPVSASGVVGRSRLRRVLLPVKPYGKRDRIAAALCNWILRHVASERYRKMVDGSVRYGLAAAKRDESADPRLPWARGTYVQPEVGLPEGYDPPSAALQPLIDDMRRTGGEPSAEDISWAQRALGGD